MKLPETIKIQGIDYKIVLNSEFGELTGFAGNINHSMEKITLSSTESDNMIIGVLIHELIHAIDYYGELGLNHQNVNIIGSMLTQILLDNNLLRLED
jgi:hypothetical protein